MQQKQREIVLGTSLSRFMSELGLDAAGGRWGSIPRLRDQVTRLMACSISCTWESEHALSIGEYKYRRQCEFMVEAKIA
ncbi:replication protein RepA [Falsochrobactrum shanghaiense]|uniref:replication protein RepA n=1 Tax=Falsochrobactrum shanghaiense TaxID=2201899 RepID=UPI003CC9359E